jgi:flagellar basal-body rod modification protein FlgD
MATTANISSTGSTSGSTAAATASKNTLGKDEFLKMFIAQLKNQDPLNPLNGTEFTSQLAQFTSLEQLYNMNDNLESLGKNQGSLNNLQAVGMIGKEVVAQGDTIHLDGSSAEVSYVLSGDAGKTQVKIYDTAGKLVDTLTPGSQKAGTNTVSWNAGSVPKGDYTFEVTAEDVNGKSVSVDKVVKGEVTEVNFKDGQSYLTVNGVEIAFTDVLSVKKQGAN